MEKNGHKNGKKRIGTPPAGKPKLSELGQRLREISDKALASGTTRLSHDQIQRLISEVRGGELL
jgi:hypothetical protein